MSALTGGTLCDSIADIERRRAKTAIRRYRCSRPIAIAVADGIISTKTSVFDYGCGHGADVRYLRSKHISIGGWDPQHRPKAQITPAHVVNLAYVLNIIENPEERRRTLTRAFELAEGVLLVAVRVDRALEEAPEFGDGHLTGTGTFQKIYTQVEFRDYIDSILGRRCYLIGPGIAYVFRSETLEARYLATRAFTRRLEYRTDLIEEFSKNRTARRYVDITTRLGRLPTIEEFPAYPRLLDAFGSPERLERLTLRLVDREAFEGSRAQRREDMLTYIAMLRLQGLSPPTFHSLPAEIRKDLKSIWSSYKSALAEGEQFLFRIGKNGAVRAACESSSIGKLLPNDLYVHKSAEDNLPALLRLVIFAARQVVGEVRYDIVKIATDGRALSFLAYTDFDLDPHPALQKSVRVYLPRASFGIRDYRGSANPPILHRKDLLVLNTYPQYAKFRTLTDQEESLNLLSETQIGFRTEWESLLRERNLIVRDHTLQAEE